MTGSILLVVKRRRVCQEPPDTKNISIVGFIYHSCCTVALSSCSLECLENGAVTIMKIAILRLTRWLWQQQLCATVLTNYDFKKATKKKDNHQTSNNHPHYCTWLFLFTGIFSRTRQTSSSLINHHADNFNHRGKRVAHFLTEFQVKCALCVPSSD